METTKTGRSSWIRRTYIAVVPSLIVLWFLSGVGKNDKHRHGIRWDGVFWLCFGVLLLATLVFSVVIAIRAVHARRAALTGRSTV